MPAKQDVGRPRAASALLPVEAPDASRLPALSSQEGAQALEEFYGRQAPRQRNLLGLRRWAEHYRGSVPSLGPTPSMTALLAPPALAALGFVRLPTTATAPSLVNAVLPTLPAPLTLRHGPLTVTLERRGQNLSVASLPALRLSTTAANDADAVAALRQTIYEFVRAHAPAAGSGKLSDELVERWNAAVALIDGWQSFATEAQSVEACVTRVKAILEQHLPDARLEVANAEPPTARHVRAFSKRSPEELRSAYRAAVRDVARAKLPIPVSFWIAHDEQPT